MRGGPLAVCVIGTCFDEPVGVFFLLLESSAREGKDSKVGSGWNYSVCTLRRIFFFQFHVFKV